MNKAALIVRVLDASANKFSEDNDNPEIARYADKIRERYRINKQHTDFQSASFVARLETIEEILGVDHQLLREQLRVADVCSDYHMKRCRLLERANELANQAIEALSNEIDRITKERDQTK